MKNTHTPGPWLVDLGGGHKSPSIVGSEHVHTNGVKRNRIGVSSATYSSEVCEIKGDMSLPIPQANARLIAAAPELLEALKAMVFSPSRPNIKFAEEIIARVEGV